MRLTVEIDTDNMNLVNELSDALWTIGREFRRLGVNGEGVLADSGLKPGLTGVVPRHGRQGVCGRWTLSESVPEDARLDSGSPDELIWDTGVPRRQVEARDEDGADSATQG